MLRRRAHERTTRTIPSVMKAAAITRFGKPSVLSLKTVPVPELAPNEILIAVHVAGVGIWDTRMREGAWVAGKAKFPMVLGSDGAGTVVAKGARVRRFDVGDRVWGYQFASGKGGFYGEYVAVDADNAAPMPRRLDFAEAGAGCVTALTALQGVDDHLRVREGETVVIVGATGAVGTLAVQFAARKGAHVVATASGRDATRLVMRLGAHGAYDARRSDAEERLIALTHHGIDALLALTSGDAVEMCLEHMRPRGRVAYPNGVEPPPPRRRGIKMTRYDAAGGKREYRRLERAVNEAKLRVPIARTFPLAQAGKAHAFVEKGHVLGRVALRVRR